MSHRIIACPHAKTDHSPCIARDGNLALADDALCVGCSRNTLELLGDLNERATRSRRLDVIEANPLPPGPTTHEDLADLFRDRVAAYVRPAVSSDTERAE